MSSLHLVPPFHLHLLAQKTFPKSLELFSSLSSSLLSPDEATCLHLNNNRKEWNYQDQSWFKSWSRGVVPSLCSMLLRRWKLNKYWTLPERMNEKETGKSTSNVMLDWPSVDSYTLETKLKCKGWYPALKNKDPIQLFFPAIYEGSLQLLINSAFSSGSCSW